MSGAPPEFPGVRVLRTIGCGGFGVVFAGELEAGGVPVAVKLARSEQPGAAERLELETRALSDIGPPHVPLVRGSGRGPDGTPYVVMDYVGAPTLAALLAERAGRMSLQEALGLELATLAAVAAVHARGWAHRDLKPENIFIQGTHAILVDFGLVAPTGQAVSEITVEGEVLGTAEYMAPEQCEGRSDIDARSDIYALGAILYELVTGRPPFLGKPAVVRESQRSARPPRLSTLVPGLPPVIDEIALRCLAKAPAERYATVEELRAALAAVVLPSIQVRISPPVPILRAPAEPRVAPEDRRAVVMLLFESVVGALEVRERLDALGGQLAHASDGRYAAVFESGENPARRAERAARDLLELRVCERARVDLVPAFIQRRRDGSRRYLSLRAFRADSYPSREAPPGVSLTSALPGLEGRADAGRSEVSTWSTRGLAVVSATVPLLGRDKILGVLVADAAHVAGGGEPTVVSVLGEPGLGKSHLAAALVEKLRAFGSKCQVIALRADEPVPGGGAPMLRTLLRAALRLPTKVGPGQWRAALRSRVENVEDAAAAALALDWITADTPEVAALEAAPGALHARITVTAGEALRRLARERPLVLVLDDAHYADDVTLGALEYAALAEAQASIWVCAVARPRFARLRPQWGARAARTSAHTLGALDLQSAADLCRRLLLPVENVPEAAVAELIERAERNPLLLIELVRGLKRQGVVRRHGKGLDWYLATDELHKLPSLPLLEWSAQSELATLSPAVAMHARLCALLGAEVTIGEIEGVLSRIDTTELTLDARVGVHRLQSAGILVERAPSRFAFRHGLVREQIARSTPADVGLRVHSAAASYYAEPGVPGGEERRYARLALHAAAAGRAHEAERAYAVLADAARRRHAYLEAEALYSRAIELADDSIDPEGVRRAAAHRGRGSMRYRIERFEDALDDFSRAREVAHRLSDVAAEVELLLDEATVLDWMDEFKSSEERMLQAMDLSSGRGTPLVEARLLLGRGRSAFRFSRSEEAAALLDECAARAERLGDEAYETRMIALMLLGYLYQGLGRLDAARAALDRAIELCEQRGDLLHHCSTINVRALLWASLGDKAKMEADFARMRTLGRSLGLGAFELLAEYNLGETLYLWDDLDAAQRHVDRAIEIERRQAGDAARAVILLLGARLALYRGDEHGAVAVVARIRARQAEAELEGRMDALMAPLEDTLATMVELVVQDAGDDAWDALEARSAECSVGQEHVEVLELRAVAALRHGRKPEARAQLQKALAAAARIPNVLGARLARRVAEAAG